MASELDSGICERISGLENSVKLAKARSRYRQENVYGFFLVHAVGHIFANQRSRLHQALKFQSLDVFPHTFRRILEALAMVLRCFNDEPWREIEEMHDELVRMLSFDVEFFKDLRRKIGQVASDDDTRACLDR